MKGSEQLGGGRAVLGGEGRGRNQQPRGLEGPDSLEEANN